MSRNRKSLSQTTETFRYTQDVSKQKMVDVHEKNETFPKTQYVVK